MSSSQLESDCKRKRLKSFLNNVKYTDCTFVIGGVPIKAHKLILAGSSPVFEKMFYGDLAVNTNFEEIYIPDVDLDEFKLMLDFVYTDIISLSSVHSAWSLFCLANKYLMDDLTTACLDFISRNLSVSSLLMSYEFAEMFFVENLKMQCRIDINHFTSGVLLSDYHMKPSTLISIIEDYELLNIKNAELIIRILEWAVVECENKNVEISTKNVLKLLNDFDLFNFVRSYSHDISITLSLEPIIFECLSYFKMYNVIKDSSLLKKSQTPWALLSKFRQVYKIARKVDIFPNTLINSNISVNKKVVLLALVVNTEVPVICSPSDYEGIIEITVLEKINKNHVAKSTKYKSKMTYLSIAYVPLENLVILNPVTEYTIEIRYFNLNVVEYYQRGVLFHHASTKISCARNDTVFSFSEVCGSVIRGISYYLA